MCNEEKANFSPPDCCLADVTQEQFIAGGQLAGSTYAKIKSDYPESATASTIDMYIARAEGRL